MHLIGWGGSTCMRGLPMFKKTSHIWGGLPIHGRRLFVHCCCCPVGSCDVITDRHGTQQQPHTHNTKNKYKHNETTQHKPQHKTHTETTNKTQQHTHTTQHNNTIQQHTHTNQTQITTQTTNTCMRGLSMYTKTSHICGGLPIHGKSSHLH
jgi:hypothetical protein